MSLDSSLSIANGSLANINRQIALLSHNIANANTAHYVREVAGQESLTADGLGMGVVSRASTRAVDVLLQGQALLQTTTVSGLDTTRARLAAIDPVLGKPGQGDDLPSLLGKVASGFSALLSAPDNQARQAEVLGTSASLARQINTLSEAYGNGRQAAHDDLALAVGTLNTTLTTIGTLSDRIVTLKSSGRSSADLENQRDAAVYTLSGLIDARMLSQPNGNLLIVTSGGLSLPLRQDQPFSIAGANLDAASAYGSGSVPGVMLNGVDVTRQLQAGRIGADIALRDKTLPVFQAELDEFAANLAQRFSLQGLTLFTNSAGAVPSSAVAPTQSGYLGFAGTIQVNPALSATPSMLRDGTHAIVGDPAGATAFNPNPPGGPAGFTGLIDRILRFALGTEASKGVPHPAFATTGLGANGTLSAPFVAPGSLAGFAQSLVVAQARESAEAASQHDTESAVQSSLDTRMAAISGVDLDKEMATMIQLQTAYGASARIISVMKSLFDELLSSVR